MSRRRKNLWLGGAIWSVALIGLATLAWAKSASIGPPAARLGQYVFSRPERVEVELSGWLLKGDPVRDPEWGYVGRVAAIEGDLAAQGRGPYRATLEIDPEVSLPPGARFAVRTAEGDWAWIMATLLPPEKRAMVIRELEIFARDHRGEIEDLVRPIADDVIARATRVLEANLAEAVKARETQIQALMATHRELIREDLVPVLKKELGPMAKEKADPILREIGRELWDELPMWSLGWNAFVDALPGTSKQRVDRWWREFVEQKAIPILAAHEQDLLKALEELIEQGARSPEVRRALSKATRRLIKDERFQKLARGILEDALLTRFDVTAFVEEVVSDPAHQQRMRRLLDRLEPVLRRVGRRLTTDGDGRIDPNLARVLRRTILRKDQRWVEVRVEPLDVGAAGEGPSRAAVAGRAAAAGPR